MRISDWSSDVCSSDLQQNKARHMILSDTSIRRPVLAIVINVVLILIGVIAYERLSVRLIPNVDTPVVTVATSYPGANARVIERSEEHTSELQSLMRISYAVFCLKKKKKRTQIGRTDNINNGSKHITHNNK